MRLETKLDLLLPTGDGPFRVIAFELTHDGEGWSVNTPFTMLSKADRAETISILRSRWEVFKLNYLPKARVGDITDSGCERDMSYLECDCVSFAEVLPAD